MSNHFVLSQNSCHLSEYWFLDPLDNVGWVNRGWQSWIPSKVAPVMIWRKRLLLQWQCFDFLIFVGNLTKRKVAIENGEGPWIVQAKVLCYSSSKGNVLLWMALSIYSNSFLVPNFSWINKNKLFTPKRKVIFHVFIFFCPIRLEPSLKIYRNQPLSLWFVMLMAEK